MKKPKLNVNQEDVLRQQMYQRLLLRQYLIGLQNCNTQLKVSMQLQRQQMMRHHLQQQQMATHQISSLSSLPDGICSRRIMQYLYHLRNRPQDNNIAYWRKFVSEYYAPAAKKRWCLSMYENISQHALGGFSQAAMEAWSCDICGSKLGKGFEANFETLPRLFEINFKSGVVDEILFLELPQEHRFPSGLMMLDYGKAVLESVYEQCRVVREGKLRVFFRQDLKILSWEFCAWQHEEFLLCREVVPQVNQLVEAAHKYRSTISDSPDTVSAEKLQSNCNMFATSGRQLARTMELPMVNDIGFPKRYTRCLQIAEVFNIMKDLMAFSCSNKMGPLESLKYYSQESTMTNIQMKGMEEQRGSQSQIANERRFIATNFSPGNKPIDSRMINDGVLSGAGEVGMALPRNYRKVERQTSVHSTARTTKQEKTCLIDQTSHPITSRLKGPQPSNSGQIQNTSLSKSRSLQSSEGSNNLEQQLIQKLRQEMVADGRAKSVQSANARTGITGNGLDVGSSMAAAIMRTNLLSNAQGSAEVPKTAYTSDSLSVSASKVTIKKEPYLPEFQVIESFPGTGEKYS